MLTVLLLQKLSGMVKVFGLWLHLLLFVHTEQMLITTSCCCSCVQPLCNCTAQLLPVQNSNYCCLEVKCWVMIEVGNSSVSRGPKWFPQDPQWARLILLSCPEGGPRPLLCEDWWLARQIALCEEWFTTGETSYLRDPRALCYVPAKGATQSGRASQCNQRFDSPQVLKVNLYFRCRIWFWEFEVTFSHRC